MACRLPCVSLPPFLALVLASLACGPGPSRQAASAPAGAVTQADPARATNVLPMLGEVVVTWLQDRGDGRDTLARGRALVPMLWDSESRQERPLVADPGSYAKPLIVPDGERAVIVSDRAAQRIWLSRGAEQSLTPLGAGVALSLWRAPDATVWVYAGLDPTEADPGEYRRLERFQLARPERRESVPLRGIVNEDNFQLTPDGRLAGGVFPWPKVGWFDPGTGTAEVAAEGCWAGVSQGGAPLLCYLDGAHRRMTIIPRAAPDDRWSLSFDAIPALRGHEIYHPRWTNHPRVMALTGPYVASRAGEHAVRAGGTGVEIYLVLLNAGLTSVEGWVRVTTNERADFYPDARLSNARLEPAAPRPGPSTAAASRATSASASRLVVQATLMDMAETPSLRDIAPYTQALVAGRYTVTQVIEGQLDAPVIAVAHWVIRDRKPVAKAARLQGASYRLTIEPFGQRSDLEGERLIMTPDAAALPLYYDQSSR